MNRARNAEKERKMTIDIASTYLNILVDKKARS